MQKLIKFPLLAILFLFSSSIAFAQEEYRMNKKEKKTMKKLMRIDWQTKNIEQDGKFIDFNSIAGPAYLYFYIMKEKQKDKRKKLKVNKWKMEISGQDRIFNYHIKGDSIVFEGLKGWNDMRIIILEKDRLVMDQLNDGSIIRWNMVPKEEEEF